MDHDGKLIEDTGWCWDHADQRHLSAHDYLFINYVNPSGKHDPLDFRRFRKREQCDDTHPFRNHTDIAKELIDWVVTEDIPGDFTFNSSFAHGPIMNHIPRHGHDSIGDLKFKSHHYGERTEPQRERLDQDAAPPHTHQVHGRRVDPVVFHQDRPHPQCQPLSAIARALIE